MLVTEPCPIFVVEYNFIVTLFVMLSCAYLSTEINRIYILKGANLLSTSWREKNTIRLKGKYNMDEGKIQYGRANYLISGEIYHNKSVEN